MKLKDCPFILKAFVEIEADNAGIYSRPILGETKVPLRWCMAFEVAEGTLAAASKRNVPKRLPKRFADYDYKTLYDMIVASGDDSTSWALKRMGKSNKVIASIEDLFYHFFDGTLSETFTGPRPSTRRH